MRNIVRGTTPTIKITFSEIDPSTIEIAYLVIKQLGISPIEVPFDRAVLGNDYISFTLTQNETLTLIEGNQCEIYCDWKTQDGTRGRSKACRCTVEATGKDEVI